MFVRCVGLFVVWGCSLCGAVRCVGLFVVWGCSLCGAVRCVGLFVVWGCSLCGAVRCVGLFHNRKLELLVLGHPPYVACDTHTCKHSWLWLKYFASEKLRDLDGQPCRKNYVNGGDDNYRITLIIVYDYFMMSSKLVTTLL